MDREGSAVSRAQQGRRVGVYQVRDVYYWRGAVLTYGHNKKGEVIEMQKDGTREALDELIRELEAEMKVKFKRQTVSLVNATISQV